MNSANVVGYTQDGAAYCLNCMAQDPTNPEQGTIFAGSEWDHWPTCSGCGERLTDAGLTDDGYIYEFLAGTQFQTMEDVKAAIDADFKRTIVLRDRADLLPSEWWEVARHIGRKFDIDVDTHPDDPTVILASREKELFEWAQDARAWFERKTRANGEQFWATKEGRPQWVQDLCHDAHSGMFPDDWKYEFIVDALDILANEDDDDSLEADIYTADLTAWLASHNGRTGYVDDAVKELYGNDYPGLIEALQAGQIEERREVFGVVQRFLEDDVTQYDTYGPTVEA